MLLIRPPHHLARLTLSFAAWACFGGSVGLALVTLWSCASSLRGL